MHVYGTLNYVTSNQELAAPDALLATPPRCQLADARSLNDGNSRGDDIPEVTRPDPVPMMTRMQVHITAIAQMSLRGS